MKKVCFLIPASATAGFMSQVAAFDHALSCLNWTKWQHSVVVCFGEAMDRQAQHAHSRWQPYLRNITIVLAPEAKRNDHYYNQIDGVLRMAPCDADVLVRVDADTLVVSEIEDILDTVLSREAIAGVMAHWGFPTDAPSNIQAWSTIGKKFLNVPLRFECQYSLADVQLPHDDRCSPYYLNDGCVFFSRRYLNEFMPHYLDIRERVMGDLKDPYFAGQVALAMAVTKVEFPKIELPMRFNFPNDQIAAARYPDEMENMRIVHYLRQDEFNRQEIFASPKGYDAFMSQSLNKPNQIFRDHVRRILGQTFPF